MFRIGKSTQTEGLAVVKVWEKKTMIVNKNVALLKGNKNV